MRRSNVMRKSGTASSTGTRGRPVDLMTSSAKLRKVSRQAGEKFPRRELRATRHQWAGNVPRSPRAWERKPRSDIRRRGRREPRVAGRTGHNRLVARPQRGSCKQASRLHNNSEYSSSCVRTLPSLFRQKVRGARRRRESPRNTVLRVHLRSGEKFREWLDLFHRTSRVISRTLCST